MLLLRSLVALRNLLKKSTVARSLGALRVLRGNTMLTLVALKGQTPFDVSCYSLMGRLRVTRIEIWLPTETCANESTHGSF